MIKKKLLCSVICFFLVSNLCLSLLPITYAAQPSPQVTLEQAMAIVRDKLTIPKDYKQILSFLNNDTNDYYLGIPRWTIYYGIQELNEGLMVEIDAMTGDIVKINWTEFDKKRYTENTQTKNYSNNEAQRIAEDFIRKLLKPSDFEQLYLWGNRQSYEEQNYPVVAKFYFKRVINGYPFSNDGIEIFVDKETGKVLSYLRVWNNEYKPPVGGPISPDDAFKIFHEKVGIELGYVKRQIYDPDTDQTKEQLVPAYYPRLNSFYINALTGKIELEYGAELNKELTEQEYIPLNSFIPGTAQQVTSEQALVKATEAARVPADYVLMKSDRYADLWSFYWERKDDWSKYIKAEVDANTGDIVQLYYSSLTSDYTAPNRITLDAAREKAITYIKQFTPSKIHLLGRQKFDYDWIYSITGENPSYRFYFPMMINGLPFRECGVTVTISSNGTLEGYGASIREFEALAPDNLISAQEARTIFNRRFISNIGYAKTYKPNFDKTVILAYRGVGLEGLVSGNYIDAKVDLSNKGECLIYEERELVKEYANHWAGGDITKLTSMRIIDYKDGVFNPDSPITRAEMVKMLVKALKLNTLYPAQPSFNDVTKSNMYMGYIEAARQQEIVLGSGGKFRPDSYLTREEMAVILSKVIPLPDDKAAIPSFIDAGKISAWAKGGVDKTAASGLIKGDTKGNFNPNRNVSWAEASAMLARLIERID